MPLVPLVPLVPLDDEPESPPDDPIPGVLEDQLGGIVPFRPGAVFNPGAVSRPGAVERPGAVALPERPDDVLDEAPGDVRPVLPVAAHSAVVRVVPVVRS